MRFLYQNLISIADHRITLSFARYLTEIHITNFVKLPHFHLCAGPA
jgi:hypothetical protein